TPPDYQPPGFKEGTLDNMMFEGEPVFLSVGEVATPFHILRVKVTTDSDRMEQLDWELPKGEDGTAAHTAEPDPNEQVEINDCLPAESPTTSPVIVPANDNAEAQKAEARALPEAEETVDKPSPGNTSPALA
ncbi:HORMA domain-containing protein 1-like, partial [Chiloscyllium plagiosum]|uniref:HORMA domain-containing protein 1-like n=1 Tax=Chiloscyllium plagiosum TaxID=36176 RepID=UPI001CB7AF81